MGKKFNRREFLKNIPFLPASLLNGTVEAEEREEVREERENKEEIISLIRPPYSKGGDFSLCRDCEGSCVTACEEGIIKRYKDGSPYIAFNYRGCTFCEKCAEACEYGVLDKSRPAKIELSIKINQQKCLAWNGVLCFACKDPCLDNAIQFEGMFNPIINTEKCSGCGFCLSVCPQSAIDIFPPEGNENYI